MAELQKLNAKLIYEHAEFENIFTSPDADKPAEPLAEGLGLGVVALGVGSGDVADWDADGGMVVADGTGVGGDDPGVAPF